MATVSHNRQILFCLLCVGDSLREGRERKWARVGRMGWGKCFLLIFLSICMLLLEIKVTSTTENRDSFVG
jgi:hypothetical protein